MDDDFARQVADADRGRTMALLSSLGRIQVTLDLLERRLGRVEEGLATLTEVLLEPVGDDVVDEVEGEEAYDDDVFDAQAEDPDADGEAGPDGGDDLDPDGADALSDGGGVDEGGVLDGGDDAGRGGAGEVGAGPR